MDERTRRHWRMAGMALVMTLAVLAVVTMAHGL